jgi:hypothetical protein
MEGYLCVSKWGGAHGALPEPRVPVIVCAHGTAGAWTWGGRCAEGSFGFCAVSPGRHH